MPSNARPDRLFAPLGPTYERAGRLLSLGLERGWRRRLIERAAPRAGGLYLDVATGTGLVARGLRERADCRVIGLDLTPGMLAAADRGDGVRFVVGRAERLPFTDGRFDGLTFTYLLRYVDDPAATLRELARVVRPGGRIAMLEFGRPEALPLRLGWWLYTRLALPVLGSLVSGEWRGVGSFLGGSIDRFYDRYEMDAVWRDAGIENVRTERLGMGSAVVTSGTASNDERHAEGSWVAAEGEARDPRQRRPAARRTSPAFYALSPGSWRDYVTLLHPPYTLWHLSYVALGAALANELRPERLAGSLVAFFLALGIGVHALDELSGRPLRTRIPDAVLRALAVLGLGGAVALGVAALPIVGPGLGVLIVVGLALALAYPLELARGRLHSDLWFALGWGAFPVITGAFASGGSITAAAVLGAVYAAALSYAQRRLSTWVRMLRRRAVRVDGRIDLADGMEVALDRRALTDPAESALRWLTAASVLVALAAVAARLL